MPPSLQVMWSSFSGEIGMEEQCCGDALADLAEAVAIQDELANHRLVLEWGKELFDRLLRKWIQIETHEGLAYEDKVISQLQVLDEATASLWHLHKTLGCSIRVLKDHRQQLGQMEDPLGL
jgi:hypothetical protein